MPEPKYRLEFVGDSITSGEGTVGAVYEEDWISAFFSAENTYPRMVADALSAEYRVISQSGWGYAIILREEFSCLESITNRDTINWILKKLNTGGRTWSIYQRKSITMVSAIR